jgi:SAM-dependent methyltransferase
MTTEFMDNQYELAYPDGIENHWWHLARNRIVLDEIKKFMTVGSAVLDVGCGRGITVKYLRQEGVDCKGVELASARALVGMDKHIHFAVNAVELPCDERSRYYIILLLDVIEHFADPVAFLQSLVSAFVRLSHVIITVPARSELWSNYDVFYGHHRRYTPEMIEDLAGELGWELVHQAYFFRPPYLPARALAALKKERKTKIDPPQGLTRIVHRLISYGMILEQHVLPRRVPGTSVLACFRTPKSVAKQGSTAYADMPGH